MSTDAENRTDGDVQPTLPVPALPPGRPFDWRRSYQRRLWITDFLALVWVVYGTQIAWFGLGNAQVAISEDSRLSPISYWVFSAALILLWLLVLSWNDSRSDRVIGAGPTEYVNVVDGSLRVFGAVAIVAFLTKTDVARGFLIISLPLGVLVLLLERWLWRQWLIQKRAGDEYSARVLLIGSRQSVAAIGAELQRARSAGYLVVGCCVPTAMDGEEHGDIPVLGTVDEFANAMTVSGADTIAITSTDELPPFKVKQISWQLQGGSQHLVLAPNIVDIAGPRLHTRPVAGLPLIHVETPRLNKGQEFIKRSIDIVLGGVALLVLSPLMGVLAIIVKLSSPGPVLFLQERVGFNGRPFAIIKFRTMIDGAESMLPELLTHRTDVGNEVLFKLRDDPRVTAAGRFLRRYSLDELPQLFNVLGGSMSLVGPRPALPREVEQYADFVHRRFIVKPGITGLWQVSGRSTLSWDESVRLDLAYVENWNILTDLILLARTIRAVLRPGETAT